MPISFHCSSCSGPIRVSRQHAGKRGKCPRCGTVQTVPAGEGTDVGSQDLEPFEVEAAPGTESDGARAASQRTAIQEEWKKAAARERKIAKSLVISLLVSLVVFFLILKFGVLGLAGGVGVGAVALAAIAVVGFALYCLWWHIRQQKNADTNWPALAFMAVAVLGAGLVVSRIANKGAASGRSQSTDSPPATAKAECTEDAMLFPTVAARDAAIAASAIGRSDYAVVAAVAAGSPTLSKGTSLEIIGVEILRVKATGEMVTFYQVRVCSGPSINSVGWVLIDSVRRQ